MPLFRVRYVPAVRGVRGVHVTRRQCMFLLTTILCVDSTRAVVMARTSQTARNKHRARRRRSRSSQSSLRKSMVKTSCDSSLSLPELRLSRHFARALSSR
ncbi:hypothetical protein PENSPDRAFT_654860 [Peniophora sp. CONT]|nr:hypothetical protein PENSPDRAFT_654860 [Peniophora sp. CONT]